MFGSASKSPLRYWRLKEIVEEGIDYDLLAGAVRDSYEHLWELLVGIQIAYC